jgi:hypothetical protein
VALYQDNSGQTPWDKELASYGSSAGQITNETTGETTNVARSSPQPQRQPQQQGQPTGGDINQFLDWAVKNKLGFNPLTMNPTMEALDAWNQKESELFNNTFRGTGITPSSMTPDALKHWNAQKKEGIAAFMQQAQQKQQTGVAYLNMLKQGWEEANTVSDKVTIDPSTGEQVYTNKFGQIVANPNVQRGEQTTGRSVSAQAGGEGETVKPTSGGIVKPKTQKEAKQISQESINQLAEMATTYDRLVEVGKKLAGKPDMSGPLQGRLNALRVKYQNDGETQTVINELKSLITIAYALSGKQISEKEMKLLQEAMLPTLNQPSANLLATISFARDWLAQGHNKRLEYQTASGYTHGIKPLAVGNIGNGPQELPAGWTRDASGNVFNDKGKKMKWRD